MENVISGNLLMRITKMEEVVWSRTERMKMTDIEDRVSKLMLQSHVNQSSLTSSSTFQDITKS